MAKRLLADSIVEVARRWKTACVLALALSIAACGGSNENAPSPKRVAKGPGGRPSSVLEEKCGRDSWTPNEQTFYGDRRWRRHSITIGPITLVDARRARGWSLDRLEFVKFRTLVRPDTDITVTIGAAARRDVGFVYYPTGAASTRAPDAAPTLRLERCPAIPRDLRPDPTVAGVGYPMFLSVARARCVDFAVTPHGGRTIHRTISLGAGGCAERAA